MTYFDEAAWLAIVQRPNWYLQLPAEYEALLALARRSDRPAAKRIADEVYSFFERALAEGRIAVGADAPDWDAERQDVDTAVIHHTALPPGMTWQRLDAIHLTRVYARYYADPTPAEAWARGLPITSGHRRDGREVFYAYHWLVRPDGGVERLLADDETGWHAGNWDVNCRSIGICIDDDLAHETPGQAVIDAVAALIGDRYPAVTPDRIRGHREVNRATTCPGDHFLPGWRSLVMRALATRG